MKNLPAPAERAGILTAERNRKMAASAHAYVRGSTIRFYEWLEASGRATLPQGPSAWICGDCHVGNLGPIASTDGKIAIQIRDFDQTVTGNPVYDLVRLGLSLAMAARGSDLPGITTARMLEQMIEGYEAEFAPAKSDASTGSDAMPRLVKRLMRQAAGRSWEHLADERIEGVAPFIPLGKRFWPLAKPERKAIETLFEQSSVHRLVTSLRSRDEAAKLRLIDAAYWKKGCSSLGLLRFAGLAAIGKGVEETHCLIDIKQAVPAAAPPDLIGEMPRDHAERVVEGARHLSPYLGKRMLAETLLGKPVFIRELLPQDLKIEIEQLTQPQAMEMANYLARIVGRAHARQLDAADRKLWHAELQRNRSKSLDAPSWLWNSVVDLVGVHEAAYLNHCRRYVGA